jgi:hypothetical protein
MLATLKAQRTFVPSSYRCSGRSWAQTFSGVTVSTRLAGVLSFGLKLSNERLNARAFYTQAQAKVLIEG